MSAQTARTSTGASIAGLLGVAFVVLKLVHVIDWSWWWVLAPFWIPVAVGLLVIGTIVVVAGFKGWR